MDVIIVGAGLAGLMCAYTLRKRSPGLSVCIVEAHSEIGGRVRSHHTAFGHAIELGAEMVHGDQTLLNRMLNQYQIPTFPVFTTAQGDGGPSPHPVRGRIGYYDVGDGLMRYDTTDPDFVHAHQVLRDMPVGQRDQETVLQYLHRHGVSERMIALFEAGYANTLCSQLAFLPRHESARVMTGFDGDGDDVHCPEGYTSLLHILREGVPISTSWPVSHVEWRTNEVVLTSVHGYTMRSKRVVFTPSVDVMKRGRIRFHPPLPERRMRIYREIRMEPCMKLALVFRKRIWPPDFQGVICANGPVPEFWTTSESSRYYILMGFAASRFAESLGRLSHTDLIEVVLDQLERMFGNAKASCVDMLVQDWTHEPYIGGGYSSPSPNVTQEDRAYLASPIKDTLFFAGEATCHSRYMVMHAAMESGVRVAEELIKVRSRL